MESAVDFDRRKCKCRERGLPEGWICGDPTCHYVQEAKQKLTEAVKKLMENHINENEKSEMTFQLPTWPTK
jgi:hypothetical protein